MIDTGAGVIDADYRGTVHVLLFNLSDADYEGECPRKCFLTFGDSRLNLVSLNSQSPRATV